MNQEVQQKGFTIPPQSFWIASTPSTDYSSLNEDIRVDVAVVGGGIVGITSAYLLKKEGLKVALIEADRILKGTTGHTTAKVTSQHSLIYNRIKTQMGEEKAKQYADANESAISFIEQLIKEKNIDCDFIHKPAYVYTQSDKYIKNIQDEADTASKLGIKAAFLSEIPLPIPIKAAMKFDNQAQFHPRKYLLALANDIPGNGSYIFEQTRALDIKEDTPCIVYTDKDKKIFSQYVIIATHYPFYDGLGMYFTRIYPERSYALGMKIKENFPEGMFITAEDPARSLRSQPFEDGELVIVSGEHHKTGQGVETSVHYSNLIEFVKETFNVENILYRWSTQDYTTMDYVPYIGRITSDKPNIFVATGFRKWGMTNSTVSAIIFRDLIVKSENPWTDVYDPSRFNPKASAKKFVIENVNVAKNLISGKVASVPENIDISPGEGKIVDINGQRCGVFRDANDKLHVVDTTCTHMGCELQWNSAELSWDCPCHGSRFTYEGEIIEGPALKKLKGEKGHDE